MFYGRRSFKWEYFYFILIIILMIQIPASAMKKRPPPLLSESAVVVAPKSCPAPAELQIWRDRIVDNAVEVSKSFNVSQDKFGAHKKYNELYNEIEACKQKEELKTHAQCTTEIEKYLKASMQTTVSTEPGKRTTHELALGESDLKYIEDAEPYIGEKGIPAMLKSERFLSAIGKLRVTPLNSVRKEEMSNIYKQIYQLINDGQGIINLPEQRWQFIAFMPSGLAPTIDGTMESEVTNRVGRGLIHVPAEWFNLRKIHQIEKVDLFLMFTIPFETWKHPVLSPTSVSNRGLQYSVLAIARSSPSTASSFIADHFRETDQNFELFKFKAFPDFGDYNNGVCYSCHASGGIKIRPKIVDENLPPFFAAYAGQFEHSSLPAAETILKNINLRLSSVAPVHSAPTYPVSPLHEMSACSGDPASKVVVVSKGCLSCHNSRLIPVSPFQNSNFIQSYIHNGWMPLNSMHDLSVDEKTKIFSCLNELLFNALSSTLKQGACK